MEESSSISKGMQFCEKTKRALGKAQFGRAILDQNVFMYSKRHHQF